MSSYKFNFSTGKFDLVVSKVTELSDEGNYLLIAGTRAMTGALETSHGSILANDTASGVLTLGGTGGTNNENLTLDFETQAGDVIIGSATLIDRFQFNRSVRFIDDRKFSFGTSDDAQFTWEIEGNDNFQLGLGVANASYSGYFNIMRKSNMGNANRSPLATSANPVLRIYSSDVAEPLDYIEMYHDQVNGVINVGNGELNVNKVIRGTTSLWYSPPQHVELVSANPGGSGATWIPATATVLQGWQLNADAETLTFEGDVHGDWDEATDIEIKLIFESNVNNTAGADADTTDFQIVCYYKGDGEATNKTQTITHACTVGKVADHEQVNCTAVINFDEAGNVVEIGDKFSFILNLVTGTSEVADITLNHIHLRYLTKQVGVEA